MLYFILKQIEKYVEEMFGMTLKDISNGPDWISEEECEMKERIKKLLNPMSYMGFIGSLLSGVFRKGGSGLCNTQ